MMKGAFRKELCISTGRYWWVLVVHGCVGNGPASIARVVRGKSSKPGAVDVSFSGTLEECRQFQVQKGGAADGVLLVDDATPVKLATALDEEFKREEFECVNSVDGSVAVAALRRAVDSVADEVAKAGFRILVHLPVLLYEADVLRPKGSETSKAFACFCGGVSKVWCFAGEELLAALKVCDGSSENKCAQMVSFVKERYFLKNVDVEEIFQEDSSIAVAVAEDAWLFRTDRMPAFSTMPDNAAVSRIREAALFRRMFKACAVVLMVTLLVTLAFWGGVAWYSSSTQTQIAAFEKNIETRRELEKVWKKLESEKAGTEIFLSHRSRLSSSFSVILADMPANSWISHWGVNRNVHSLQGYAMTSEDVSKFLSALESEKSLVNVRLRTTEKTTFKRRAVVKFDLTAEAVQ